MFSRYASAISTSTVMTLGLIYIMQTLITIQPGVIVEPRERDYLDIFRVPEKEPPPRTRDLEIDRQKLVETVIPPTTNVDYSTTQTVGVPVPTQQIATGPIPTSFGQSDGPLVTMINVEPAYPIRALQWELEGYVIVEFDVDASGRPLNIRVVESSHQVFDKAAVKAAERIKFKARVVDGTAVATSNVRKLYRFNLDDA